jgi:GYF domain 2
MYYVIGADGRMNGPLTAAQVHQWIAEGRANKYSRVRRDDDATWHPLGSIPELAPRPPEPPAAASRTAPLSPDAIAAEYMRRGVKLDAGLCVSRGWALVRGNAAVLVGAAAVVWGIIIALTFVPRIGWLLGMLVNSILLGGLYYVNIRCIRGEPVGTEGTVAGVRIVLVPLVAAGLISGALTTFGLLLFILPAVYLAVGYMFVLPLVVDKRMEVWTALEVSRRVVHHQWWTAFALAIVATLIVLAGLLAFVVGVVIAVPVATAALMYAYEDLFGGD